VPFGDSLLGRTARRHGGQGVVDRARSGPVAESIDDLAAGPDGPGYKASVDEPPADLVHRLPRTDGGPSSELAIVEGSCCLRKGARNPFAVRRH